MKITRVVAGLAVLFFVLALGGCSGNSTVTIIIDNECFAKDGDGARFDDLPIFAGGDVEWVNEHNGVVELHFDNTAVFGTDIITINAGETKTTAVACGSGDSATFRIDCGDGPSTGPKVVVEDPP